MQGDGPSHTLLRTRATPYLVMTAGSGGGAFPLPLPIQSVPQALRLAMPIIIATTAIKVLLIGKSPSEGETAKSYKKGT